MKKNCSVQKLLSILLCSIMLLGLLPITAMAADKIEVISADIDMPKAGEKFDFTAEGSCSEYTIGNVYWYHMGSGERMSSASVAQAGQNYEVLIQVSPKSGYYIGGGYTVGLINGLQVVIDGNNLYTTYTVSNPPTQIYSVDLEVNAPVPGMKPDFNAVCGDRSYTLSTYFDDDDSDNYTENGVQWIDATTKKVMDADDTFTVGHTYQAFIHLKKNGNHEFYYDFGKVPPVAVTVLGAKSVRTAKAYERDPFEEIDIICDFACDYQTVSSVSITGLDAPKDGKAPDYSVNLGGDGYTFKTTSASNPFVVNGVSWYDETTGTDLTRSAKFVAGHTYTATIYLVPTDGSKFGGSVRGTINGNTATVSGNGSEIQLKYSYTLGTNKITSVAIEGLSAPVTGQFPSYVAIVSGAGYALKDRNDFYYKNGICWSELEGTDLHSGMNVYFEGGKQYQVTIYLTAEDGYVFDVKNLKATVNGKNAEVYGGNQNEVVIMYYFTEATSDTKLTNIEITGIDAPVIGAKPDYTANVLGGRMALEGTTTAREKNGITWESGKTGSALYVSGTKFEADVAYSVIVGVTAADGYAFGKEIHGTINGQTAEIVSQDEYNVYLSIAFDALKAAKPNTPTTPVTPPATDTPKVEVTIDFTDVSENAYYYEPVQWAVANEITNGTSKTEFSPNETCSQAHILTFLWRAVGKPSSEMANPYSSPVVTPNQYFYTPFIWSWEKGLIGNTAHDPNAPCSRSDVVTYLWKLAGKPKAKTAGFTDVAANAPYAQAVAWAVEQGITNGTSTTTFSPNETCTRGRIVTFLWRYMNTK